MSVKLKRWETLDECHIRSRVKCEKARTKNVRAADEPAGQCSGELRNVDENQSSANKTRLSRFENVQEFRRGVSDRGQQSALSSIRRTSKTSADKVDHVDSIHSLIG